MLGGGRRHFVPKVTLDPEEPDKEGRRLDGRNLIEEWARNHRRKNILAKYVHNKEQFENVDPRKINRLLGKFQQMFYTRLGGFYNLLLRINRSWFIFFRSVLALKSDREQT